MSFNLLRNSRIFFTTAVGAVSGKVNVTGTAIAGGNDASPPILASNTRELQVLDNFAFSQSTTSDTITLNEAGPVPTRGQRQFNTALNTVEFSMTTYLRPYRDNLELTNVQFSGTDGQITFDSLERPLPVGTEIIISGVKSPTATGGITPYNPLARIQAYRIQPADSSGANGPTRTSCRIGPSVTTVVGTTVGLVFKVANIKNVTKAEESCLWNAMFGPGTENGADGPGTITTGTTSKIVIGTNSNFTANIFPPGTNLYTRSINPNARPGQYIGTIASVDSSTQLTLRENALVGMTDGDWWYYGGAWKDGSYDNPAEVLLTNSNVHVLQKFGLVILMDTQAYILDDCCLNQAQIDFGLDAIAQVNWSGMAKNLRQINIPFVRDANSSIEFEGYPVTLSYFSPKITTAPFLANKLTICDLARDIAPGSVAVATLIGGADYVAPATVTFQKPFGNHTAPASEVYRIFTQVGTAKTAFAGTITAATPVTTITGITSTLGLHPGQVISVNTAGTGALGGTTIITDILSNTSIAIRSTSDNTAGTATFDVLTATNPWAPLSVNLGQYVEYTDSASITHFYKVLDGIEGQVTTEVLNPIGGTVVAIAGTAGQITFTPALGTPLSAGTVVQVTGLNTGLGVIQKGTYYVKSGTSTTGGCTLVSTYAAAVTATGVASAAIVTTAGTCTFDFTATSYTSGTLLLGTNPPTHTEGAEQNGEVILEYAGRRARGVAVMRLTATAPSRYDVNGITITDAGLGYTVPPTISIGYIGTVAPATNATATSTLSPVYSIPITGGSITISNNITYLTPALIGVVNEPVFSFTGTRSISGTLNAYLRTGVLKTSGLMAEMLEGKSFDVNPKYDINIQIGGSGNTNHVDFNVPAAVLQVPTIGADPVVSTSINFTAQSSNAGQFDLTQCNELVIKYNAV